MKTKKKFLLVAFAALMAMACFGADVNMQDAQSTAANFMRIKLGGNAPRSLTPALKYTRIETDNTVDFYVFEMAEVKGFVIISATDNDEPIIGYSTESYFPADFSKIGLNEVLNRWATEIHYVKQHNVVATPTAASHWTSLRAGIPVASEKSGISPFCQTTWDQNTEYGTGPNLYNNFCPGGGGTNQAVTGCVATTMAQIMRYWSYPPVGIGSHSYSDATSQGYQQDYGTLYANFADSTFSWSNMPLTLTNTSSTTQINAIGRLMKCAGVAVEMDYSPNGSGAIVLTSQAGGGASAQAAYVSYFGYQTIIQGIVLTGTGGGGGISSAAFTDSVEVDLARGHLVQLQGTDPSNGGHTWVCDGYETSPSVMFHMNWGWSGYADGYFAINAMNPNDGQQLTFSQNIGALIHIVPPVQPGGGHISEVAAAAVSTVCAGAPTQLSATTHTGASYTWSPTTNLSSATISNPVARPLSTTTYTVTADSAGVTATSSVTITVRSSPTATIPSATNVSCYGSSTGSATVSVSGGTAAYHYAWSTGQTTVSVTGLAAGTYKVTVTDANSCTSSATKTIIQPAVLSASTSNLVNASCGQANGSVTANASGGTVTYHYAWSNGATTATASNLAGASYHLTVTDANSCTATALATISSSGSLNLTTTAGNVTCFGNNNGSATANVTGSTGTITYHWSNGATTASLQNITAATYNVTITDGSGCSATATDVVAQPAALALAVNSTSAGCGNVATGSATATATGGTAGYSYTWSNGSNGGNITGVTSGNYRVTVSDAHGCSTTGTAVVSAASPLNVIASSTNVACYGGNTGAASVSVSGSSGAISYNWSNGATTSSISNVTSGSYSVSISDVNQCTAATNVSVTQPNQMLITTASTNAVGVNNNGTATVTNVSGGTGPYTYYWSNGGTAQTITGIAPGNYTVTITDANGCYQTAADFVNVSTGLNTISNSIAFNIYPNPAAKYVLVHLDEFNNATILSLKNILGQTVVSQLISAQQTQLDISNLANGVYLVELRQDEKVAVKQLIVVK